MQIVNSADNNEDIVLVIKKKKFPWWIFLFLLPLILLIPVKRDISMLFTEQGNSIAVAKSPAEVVYSQVSTFGGKTPVSIKDSTDTEGKFVISDVSEPLWYRLFGGASDSVTVKCSNGCYELNWAQYPYLDFPRDGFKNIVLGAKTSVATLKVIDIDNNEPLPDANVKIITIVNDSNSEATTTTDPSGLFDINSMPLCGSVRVIASKEGYDNDTLEATLFDINNMDDFEKTLKLVPQKGSVKVIVKNLNTKTLLAGATITLTIQGQQQTLKTNTNGVGIGCFDSLRVGQEISFLAQKSGYADTTLSGYTVAQFMQLDEEHRTMYLRPLTKSLVFVNTDGSNPLEGVKNVVYKNGSVIATEYSNSRGEFVVSGVGENDKLSIVATKSGYNSNTTKVKNATLAQLNTQESRTIPLTKIEQKPTPPPPVVNDKSDDLKGQSGDFRVNLQWYSKTDLDLHVIDPCGNEISFSKRRATCSGGPGNLDLDANALIGTTTRPQENVYWTTPAKGTYTIKVVCFKWRERIDLPISYNISIVDKGRRIDKKGRIAKGQTIVVCKHTVE